MANELMAGSLKQMNVAVRVVGKQCWKPQRKANKNTLGDLI